MSSGEIKRIEDDLASHIVIPAFFPGVVPLVPIDVITSAVNVNAVAATAKLDLQKIGTRVMEEWADSIQEMAEKRAEEEKSPTYIRKQEDMRVAAGIITQYDAVFSQSAAAQEQVGAVTSSALTIAMAGVGLAHEEVVGVIAKNTPFPILLYTKVVEIDPNLQATLSYLGGIFATTAMIQATADMSKASNINTTPKVRDLQYALAYARRLLMLLGKDGLFEQTLRAKLEGVSKELREALIPMLKAAFLAGALAMIYKTSLGVGKGGQVPANMSGQELRALLSGKLAITFQDKDSQQVVNSILTLLRGYLASLSSKQQDDLLSQLDVYLNDNPDLKKLEEMDALLTRNDHPESKRV